MKTKFPILVRRGSVNVKVYRLRSKLGYVSYVVVYATSEGRQRRTFSNHDEARRFGEQTATQLSNGDLEALKLTGLDRQAYLAAIAALKPTGVRLEAAAREYADAHKMLEGVPVIQAVRAFVQANMHKITQKRVDEVVAQLLEEKTQKGRSPKYLKDLGGRLSAFAEAFQVNIADVTSQDIERYILGVKGEAETRNNHRDIIGTLFNFAKKKKFIPPTHPGVSEIEQETVTEKEIQVFEPDELAALLKAARPEIVPFLAIGAFAGVRSEELCRLDWSDIRFEDQVIQVRAKSAKLRVRRLAPLLPNLREWLLPHAQKFGPVTPFENMSKQLLWLAAKVDNAWREEEKQRSEVGSQRSAEMGRGTEDRSRKPEGEKLLFKWKHNGLRHSFCSYRLAAVHDLAQVALDLKQACCDREIATRENCLKCCS